MKNHVWTISKLFSTSNKWTWIWFLSWMCSKLKMNYYYTNVQFHSMLTKYSHVASEAFSLKIVFHIHCNNVVSIPNVYDNAYYMQHVDWNFLDNKDTDIPFYSCSNMVSLIRHLLINSIISFIFTDESSYDYLSILCHWIFCHILDNLLKTLWYLGEYSCDTCNSVIVKTSCCTLNIHTFVLNVISHESIWNIKKSRLNWQMLTHWIN